MRRTRNNNDNGSHLPTTPAESVADLMLRAPGVYEKITDYLERDGLSPNAIHALLATGGLSVHPDTIRRIRNLLPIEVRHSAIRSITSNLIEAAQALSSRLVQESGTIPPGQLASSLGVLVDKISLLLGEPSQRIEVSHSKHTVSPEELKQMFDRLPKVEGREITPPANETNRPAARAPWAPGA